MRGFARIPHQAIPGPQSALLRLTRKGTHQFGRTNLWSSLSRAPGQMNGGRFRAPKEYLRQAAAQRTNSANQVGYNGKEIKRKVLGTRPDGDASLRRPCPRQWHGHAHRQFMSLLLVFRITNTQVNPVAKNGRIMNPHSRVYPKTVFKFPSLQSLKIT